MSFVESYIRDEEIPVRLGKWLPSTGLQLGFIPRPKATEETPICQPQVEYFTGYSITTRDPNQREVLLTVIPDPWLRCLFMWKGQIGNPGFTKVRRPVLIECSDLIGVSRTNQFFVGVMMNGTNLLLPEINYSSDGLAEINPQEWSKHYIKNITGIRSFHEGRVARFFRKLRLITDKNAWSFD